MSLLSFFIIIIIWTNLSEGFLLSLLCILVVLTVGSIICTLILKIINKNNKAKLVQNNHKQ